MKFETIVKGLFDLKNQSLYFGGYPQMRADPDSIVMAFPVEGWEESAAVVLHQSSPDKVEGEVYGAINSPARPGKQPRAPFPLAVEAGGGSKSGNRIRASARCRANINFCGRS